jgi:hypothetical protein
VIAARVAVGDAAMLTEEISEGVILADEVGDEEELERLVDGKVDAGEDVEVSEAEVEAGNNNDVNMGTKLTASLGIAVAIVVASVDAPQLY